MTYRQYRQWDGTYYTDEKDMALQREQNMHAKMSYNEWCEYLNMCERLVYEPSSRAFGDLQRLIKPYGFTVKDAMIAY